MGPVGASGAWVDGEAFMGLGGGKMPCCGGSGLSRLDCGCRGFLWPQQIGSASFTYDTSSIYLIMCVCKIGEHPV